METGEKVKRRIREPISVQQMYTVLCVQYVTFLLVLYRGWCIGHLNPVRYNVGIDSSDEKALRNLVPPVYLQVFAIVEQQKFRNPQLLSSYSTVSICGQLVSHLRSRCHCHHSVTHQIKSALCHHFLHTHRHHYPVQYGAVCEGS